MGQTLRKQITLNESIKNFLIDWHNFPVDYWWRKKYNVPFGSIKHRSMNLIDMSIEYVEQLEMQKYLQGDEAVEEEERDENVVHMTQEEIDEDYENLDLDKFN